MPPKRNTRAQARREASAALSRSSRLQGSREPSVTPSPSARLQGSREASAALSGSARAQASSKASASPSSSTRAQASSEASASPSSSTRAQASSEASASPSSSARTPPAPTPVWPDGIKRPGVDRALLPRGKIRKPAFCLADHRDNRAREAAKTITVLRARIVVLEEENSRLARMWGIVDEDNGIPGYKKAIREVEGLRRSEQNKFTIDMKILRDKHSKELDAEKKELETEKEKREGDRQKCKCGAFEPVAE